MRMTASKPPSLNCIAIPYDMSLDDLKSLSEAKDADARWAAFPAIAYKQNKEALEWLITLTFSDDHRVRAVAAESLKYHKEGSKAEKRLIELVHDQNEAVIWRTCETLATLGIKSAHDHVFKLLFSKNTRTRQ